MLEQRKVEAKEKLVKEEEERKENQRNTVMMAGSDAKREMAISTDIQLPTDDLYVKKKKVGIGNLSCRKVLKHLRLRFR